MSEEIAAIAGIGGIGGTTKMLTVSDCVKMKSANYKLDFRACGGFPDDGDDARSRR